VGGLTKESQQAVAVSLGTLFLLSLVAAALEPESSLDAAQTESSTSVRAALCRDSPIPQRVRLAARTTPPHMLQCGALQRWDGSELCELMESKNSPYPAAPLRRFTPPVRSDNLNFSSPLNSQADYRH
jgi:hypothetical protein